MEALKQNQEMIRAAVKGRSSSSSICAVDGEICARRFHLFGCMENVMQL